MNEVEIIGHPQVEGLNLFFNTLDYRTPHLHAELELIWIMENELQVQDTVARPGDILLFNSHQLHEYYKVEKSCTFLCFQIAPSYLRPSFPEIPQLYFDIQEPILSLPEGEGRILRERLYQAAKTYLERSTCYKVACAGWLHLAVHQLLTHLPYHLVTAEEASDRKRKNERLRRLIAFVDENYMHKLCLSDFARSEGVSMGYLSHFVKDTLHQSFQEYVETARFNCACKLIASGEKKMLDVCLESGFSDYRYFSRAFLRRVGTTPEEYRKMPKPSADNAVKTHRSLHSLEHFYSEDTSLEMLQEFIRREVIWGRPEGKKEG